ncbi:MAG: prepilin peptidase [Candidatus Falkowbacteria bacterium]
MSIVISIFVFLIGLAVGSFLNSAIWRLYEEKSFKGRSVCTHCGHQLAWYDNIPVLSFAWLRGKCRHCHKKISWQYPLVELVAAGLFLLIWQQHAANFNVTFFQTIWLLRDWVIAAALLSIFVFDFKWYLIPDIISLPAIGLLLVLNLLLSFYPGASITIFQNSWQSWLVSGIIGAGFFYLQYLISAGKWVGGGDIRLGAIMGLLLISPSLLFLALLLAYWSGALVGVSMVLVGKKQLSSKLPFGVFLVPATIIAWLWGEPIILWYFAHFIPLLVV